MKLAGVDDELVAKGENVLLSFTQVANQGDGVNAIFDRATRAGLDLATRGFGSVESNAKLLGIALSDPEVGLTRLRRAGIIFTDSQIESIKAFVKQNDLLDAQKVLLGAVEQKVGGAAAAYGKTLPGQMSIAQESLKNAKAEIVSGTAPALELMATVSTTAADAISAMPGPLRTVVATGLVASTAIGGIIRPVADLMRIFDSFKAKTVEAAAGAGAEGAAAGAAAAGNAVLAESTLAAAAGEDKVAVNSAAAVAGLYAESGAATTAAASTTAFIAAATLGIGVILAIGAATGQFGDTLDGELVKLDDFAKGLTTAFDSGRLTPFEAVLQSVNDKLSDPKVSDAFAHAHISVAGFTTALREGNGEFFKHINASDRDKFAILELAAATEKSAETTLQNVVSKGRATQADVDAAVAANRAKDGTVNYFGALQLLENQGKLTAGTTSDLTAAVDDQDAAMQKAKASVDALAKAEDGFSDFQSQLTDSLGQSYDRTVAATKAQSDYFAGIDDVVASLKDNKFQLDLHTEAGRKNTDALLKEGAAITGLIKLRFQETGSLDAAKRSGELYVQNLRDQLRQAGYTEQQVDELISTMKLTPEDIDTTFSTNAAEEQLVVGKYLQQLDAIEPRYQTIIETYIDLGKLREAKTLLDYLSNNYTEVNIAVTLPGQRQKASGGPVYAGELYQVNERGKELFAPAVNGTILSTDALERAVRDSARMPATMTVGGGGSGMSVTMNAPLVGQIVESTPYETVSQLVGRLRSLSYAGAP